MNSPLVHIKIPFYYLLFLGNLDVKKIIKHCAKVVPSNEPIELSVTFTNNRSIRKLNKKYRQIDAPTDVLSFPMNTPNPELKSKYIGDIVISIPTARKQARFYDNSLLDELSLLVIHGYLHLLGLNHKTKSGKKVMWKMQDSILENLGIHLLVERG